jgi:hypothetical protein
MLDLFAPQEVTDTFQWIVALFAGSGAVEAIKRANDIPLKTYYPIRFNGRGEPIPLWKNYLFMQYQENLTTQLCHSTRQFIKILSMRDDEGKIYPILVRKEAISENMRLLVSGRFNDKSYRRRHYGRGSIVRVVEGTFIDKRVRLEMDVEPDWPGTRKVIIDINGLKGSIELWKLSL